MLTATEESRPASTLARELRQGKAGRLDVACGWPSVRTFRSLREGQQVGAGRGRGHTPRILSKVQQRAPAHAPLRAGQAPSRRRAAAGGGSGPRFLSPGLQASSHRSSGDLRLATAAAEPAAFLALPRHPVPCPGVPPGWGRSRANPGGTAVGAVPGPAVPPAPPASGRPASGVWGAGNPRRPRSNARGGPRGPARRAQTEPWWRRSEAELCRGRAGYIVSSPRTPSRPLPPPFFPPQPGLRGHPLACLAVFPPLLFASLHLFVPHPLGTLAPLPSPLAAWTVLQAADAARGEVAWTAVP